MHFQRKSWMQAKDQQQRDEALDVSCSICVTAPAGSGKTELLTQRFLKLLATVEKPEQIQGITFTRKAVAEMKERIIAALNLGLQESEPEENYKKKTWKLAKNALEQNEKYQWNIIENPVRLKIQTFDSLCQSIVRSHPITSQLGGSLKPIDNAEELYREAVDYFFKDFTDGDESLRSLALLLEYFDNNVFQLKQLLMSMLPIRDQWLGHVVGFRSSENVYKILEKSLNKWILDILKNAKQVLLTYASEISTIVDFASTCIIDLGIDKNPLIRNLNGLIDLPDIELTAQEKWLGIAELLLTKEGEPRKSLNKNLGFPPKSDKQYGERSEKEKKRLQAILAQLSEREENLDAIRAIKKIPLGGYQEEHKKILEPLAFCLVRLCGYLQLAFSQSQQSDHVEIATAALRCVDWDDQQNNSTSESAWMWNNKIHHLLIDEFQDTSVTQYKLLTLLTAEWQHYNNENFQRPKTLFVVGDGMQSIYSFRQAKVGLFLQIRDQGLNNLEFKSVTLTQNFRSNRKIVDWLNNTFSKAFPENVILERGGVPYSYSDAFASKDNGHKAVSVMAFDENDSLAPQSEAEYIVQKIQELQNENNKLDIAILVRARSHLLYILPALNRAQIYWQGIDIEELRNEQVINDCLIVVQALINPIDDIAWYALLRAPWCGLSLVDLQKISDYLKHNNEQLSSFIIDLGNTIDTDSNSGFQECLNNYSIEFFNLNETAGERLCFIALILAKAWKQRSEKPISIWVRSVWQALGNQYLSKNNEDSSTIILVELFFRALQEFEQEYLSKGQTFNLSLFEEKIERLFSESVVKETETLPVQIMTIHKSKGLEFDVVFLPGMDKVPFSGEKPILVSHERLFSDGSQGLLLYPKPKADMIPVKQSEKIIDVYDFIYNEKRVSDSYEITRLMYVACTRAKEHLILTAQIKNNENGTIKAPASRSMLHCLWKTIKDELIWDKPKNIAGISVEEIDKDEMLIEYLPLQRFSHTAYPYLFEKLNKQSKEQNSIQKSDTYSMLDEDESQEGFEKIVGRFVHQLFELFTLQGEDYWQAIEINALQPVWLDQMVLSGIKEDDIERAIDLVNRAVSGYIKGQYIAEFLHADNRHLKCEWPLYQCIGSEVHSLFEKKVVDLTYISPANERWIIDYKIAEPLKNETVEAFLEKQKEKYTEQLMNYRRCIIDWDKQKANCVKNTLCLLYFPLIDKVVRI